MCVSPIRIKNPNHGNYISKFTREHKDTISQYINVPCGNCPACRFIRQASYFQRALVESLYSYVYFVTLTYNNDSIAHAELQGEDFTVAPFSDIQLLNKRLRNNNPFDGRNFKYFAVREYGKRTGRAHWHLLYFVPKFDSDDRFLPYVFESSFEKALLLYYSINVGSDTEPVYKSRFTDIKRFAGGKCFRPFDCQHIDTEKSVLPLFYVLKYLSKDSALYKKIKILALQETEERTETTLQKILNDFKPKAWKSIYFGIPKDSEGNDLAKPIVEKSLAMSVSAGACFPSFYLDDITLPLCDYYRKRYMTDKQDLFFKRKQIEVYGFPFSETPSADDVAKTLQRFDLRDSRHHSEDLFDIIDIDDV